jgi:hypothetical protein
MAQQQDEQKLSPFARAEAEARKAREAARRAELAAEGASAAPRAADAAVFGRAASPQEARAPFLATEAAQYMKAQEDRMERARKDAAKQRLHLEAERLKSFVFIKRQELARVATRLRASESSLVAAQADERRAKATAAAASSTLHEKMAARAHLQAERTAAEHDFERREVGEATSAEAIERDLNAYIKRGGNRYDPRYQELDRKRHDRSKGLASIQRERIRRRSEAASRDAAVAREIASAERSGQSARRAGDLAASLVAKYEQQVRAFQVAEQTLKTDAQRLEHDLARAEAELRALGTR